MRCWMSGTHLLLSMSCMTLTKRKKQTLIQFFNYRVLK
uniref:Uncharacterized protein n=1 Tax=Anguilla anguilla TaxID=7936 RepID=A0A0E9VYM0_ANGAN